METDKRRQQRFTHLISTIRSELIKNVVGRQNRQEGRRGWLTQCLAHKFIHAEILISTGLPEIASAGCVGVCVQSTSLSWEPLKETRPFDKSAIRLHMLQLFQHSQVTAAGVRVRKSQEGTLIELSSRSCTLWSPYITAAPQTPYSGAHLARHFIW